MSIENRDDKPEARLEQLAAEIGEECRLAEESWQRALDHDPMLQEFFINGERPTLDEFLEALLEVVERKEDR